MSNPLVGIIAEDDSDVNCLKHFILRSHESKRIGFKKFVGQGCGKISRKANSWAQTFKTQGCSHIILLHDLDRNTKDELKAKIDTAFLPCPVKKHFVSIAIEELEAWLLSDPVAFKSVFNIKEDVRLPLHPEKVESPKEFIASKVRAMTNKRVDYLNTRHNEKLSEIIDLNLISTKCPSFKELKDFIDDI